jgi:hypothetical protein
MPLCNVATGMEFKRLSRGSTSCRFEIGHLVNPLSARPGRRHREVFGSHGWRLITRLRDRFKRTRGRGAYSLVAKIYEVVAKTKFEFWPNFGGPSPQSGHALLK